LHNSKIRGAISTLAIFLVIGIVIVIVGAAMLFSGYSPFLSGRIVGSGNLVMEDLDFTDFSVVRVESGFDVEITQSSAYQVSITVDDNVMKRIQASKTGDTLTIGIKTGSILQSVTLKAKIATPELERLEFSGGTQGTVDGFSSSNKFNIDLSGGSQLDMDDISLGDIDIELSGGSTIEIEGEADDMIISASDGSSLRLSDFQVKDANVELDGGSNATINLDGKLDADLSGGSTLLYIGNPEMGDVNTSGGATIGKK
jgi:hypothetical protein